MCKDHGQHEKELGRFITVDKIKQKKQQNEDIEIGIKKTMDISSDKQAI